MRTPAEKKRLTWLLLAILLFFANLTLVTVLLFNSMFPPKPAGTGGGAASQTRPATGP
jgi:hypothetical protein